MLKTATAFAACLALASCQTTQLDTAIRQSLPQICSAADVGYNAFKPFAVAGRVKQKTVEQVDVAYGQLQVLCANRDTATLASTLVSATTAYVVITSALKEAKKNDS